jgi:hypothetical protein
MKWTRIFVLVSCGALGGMVMGGLFGLEPAVSRQLSSLTSSLGATLSREALPQCSAVSPGVLLGGGLATFGIIVQILMQKRNGKS